MVVDIMDQDGGMKMKTRLFKMIITSKESGSILHIEKDIPEHKIVKYIDCFYNQCLQNCCNYKFEEIKEDQ